MSAQDAKLLLAGDDEEIAKWFCEDMQVHTSGIKAHAPTF